MRRAMCWCFVWLACACGGSAVSVSEPTPLADLPIVPGEAPTRLLVGAGGVPEWFHGASHVTVSPDGTLLAVAARSRDVVIASTQTGELVRTLRARVGGDWPRDDLAFSPDGRLLGVTTNGQALIFDVAGSGERRLGNDRVVDRLAFSPDSSLVAARVSPLDRASKVVVYNARSGAEVRVLEAEGWEHFQPALAGALLVALVDRTRLGEDARPYYGSAGDAHLLVAWDLGTGHERWRQPCECGDCSGPSIAPDGGSVLVDDCGEIRERSAATGAPTDLRAAASRSYRLAPDGSWIVTADVTSTRYDRRGRVLARFPGLYADSIGIGADTLTLANTSAMARLSLRDFVPSPPLETHWGRAEILAAGRAVATLGSDRQLMVRDPQDLRVLTRLPATAMNIALTLAGQGDPRGVPQNRSNAIRVALDAYQSRAENPANGLWSASSVAMSADRVAIAGDRNEIRTLEGARSCELGGAGSYGTISELQFSPDGELLLGCEAQGLRLWRSDDCSEVARIDECYSGSTFSPDGRQIAFHLNELRVVLWDVERRERGQTIETQRAISAIAWSRDGRFLAVAGDEQVQVYALPDARPLGQLTDVARVTDLAFLPDGRLVSTTETGHVSIWGPDAG